MGSADQRSGETDTGSPLVDAQIERWAEELIDLSGRNRLLYFRHSRSASLEFAQTAPEVCQGLERPTGWGVYLPPPPEPTRSDVAESGIADDVSDAPTKADELDPDDMSDVAEAAVLEEPDEVAGLALPVYPSEARADQLVVDMRPARYGPQIERGLQTLQRNAQAEFVDRGLWVLYLALGTLTWIDDDRTQVTSPLLLRPVRLLRNGAARAWRVVLSDDGEAALNPALAVKLEKDFGITLPSLDDLDEPDATTVMQAVEDAVDEPTWRVEPRALLRTFSFQKEVIYRDLRRNSAQIAAHPMVRRLVEDPAARIPVAVGDAGDAVVIGDPDLDPDGLEPVSEDELDTRHPPEDLACVLDADATQRQCVVAARQGHSFVMDGPPGTGKSQTIANVIAQLLVDGKTVLFVSEKAAALDVVQTRLAERKLDPFVLPLHSHTATRKAVAQLLGQALDERPRATERFDATHRARLRRERERLTAYAMAMNLVRHPLGRSLHDVIGRISQLADLPDVPVPDVRTHDLDAAELSRLCETAAQLGRSWAPVAVGDEFVWRELQDLRAGAGRLGNLRREVNGCRTSLSDLESVASVVADDLGLPEPIGVDDAERARDLVVLAERRLPVDPLWLQVEDTDQIDDDVVTLAAAWRRRHELAAGLDADAPRWADLPVDTTDELRWVEQRLAALDPSRSTLEAHGQLTAAELRARADSATRAGAIAQQLDESTTALADIFGVDGPPPNLALAERLAALGGLAGTATPPEAGWLDPATAAQADEAHQVLTARLAEHRDWAARLREVFTDDVLDLDLVGLRLRFREVHTGLRKLGRAHRRDKRALAQVARSGKVDRAVLTRLDDALAWQEARQRLRQAEARFAPVLGAHHWPSSEDADPDRIERAVATAHEARRLAGTDVPTAALVAQLARGAAPDPQLSHLTAEVARLLAAWHDAMSTLDASVTDEALVTRPLADVRDWLDAGAAALAEADDLVARVVAVTVAGAGPALTWAEADDLAARRAAHADVERRADEAAAHLRPFAGDVLATADPAVVERAAQWVADVRSRYGGPLPADTATALLHTPQGSGALTDALDLWDKSIAAVLSIFHSGYADELRRDLHLSFGAGDELLGDLAATVREQVPEWVAFSQARTTLAEAGWGPAIDAAVAGRIPADQVAGVVERTVLQRWADEIVAVDQDLEPWRAKDRESLVGAFRELDRAQVADAAARVVNVCAERRPRLLTGQAGIIRQQSERKRRHKPVRELLTVAGDAAQQLKPCFMMTPVQVSQLLPPTLRFDVVVFDEASQVREADAVGAIYRGDQLIVAGDPRQLPPTNFFQRLTDYDDEDVDDDLLDYESLLDRVKAQGLPALQLRWHYRSRHEDLITFSNRSFYEGRLHTFPGAVASAPNLGVELFRVGGVYARGGARDNPVEAGAVVDRLLHHRREHPDLSVGIVALSGAQQFAIDAEIERRARTEPELAALDRDDRLHGLFVKNLETVQGDERDVVILSIGYGRDEAGKLTANFGPMSRQGGERRLNVAVTRARRRIEVVCSFDPGEVTSNNATARHLLRYLDYAQRGVTALALDDGAGGGDGEPQSPFEEDVLRIVRGLGYDVQPQVGVAGYRIDIGVHHPSRPSSYVLGVECDGATYHSSRVARDRDRLRDQVLQGLGWTMHHIWSTEWHSNRNGEIARLRDAVEEAIGGGRRRDRTSDPSAPEAPDVTFDVPDYDGPPDWAGLYEEPVVRRRRSSRLTDDIADDRAQPELAQEVRLVVEAYGPIHLEVVTQVVCRAWGLRRVGSRAQDAVHLAARRLLRRRDIQKLDDFLFVPGRDVEVRVPPGDSVTPRKVRHVPPAELDLAIVQILRDGGPAARADLRTYWARLFGWKRTGPEIESAFDAAVDRLTRMDQIAVTDSPADSPAGTELRLPDPAR